MHIKQNNKHKEKPMTAVPDLGQAHEVGGMVGFKRLVGKCKLYMDKYLLM